RWTSAARTPHSFPTRRSSDLVTLEVDRRHRALVVDVRPHRLRLAGVDVGRVWSGHGGRRRGRRDHLRLFALASPLVVGVGAWRLDRKSTRLNSSHVKISYAVF